ncbi:MAG: LpxD N-terminal domain-containing protein, partial [Flavobacteriales bacterium]|nr:LpxD N-terminal domain-containing protein [Flavobacteriales bacterium]
MKFKIPITAGQLAKELNATCLGNASLTFTGINEIHRVQDGDITFCDNPKYYKKALASNASVILINGPQEVPSGKVLIVVKQPFKVFTALTKRYREFEVQNQMISPSAHIGTDTRILPGVFIGKNVKIGKDCLVHPNVTIYDACEIGDRVEIHSGAVIGSDAFYYQKTDGYQKLYSCGSVKIENDVEIGAGCTIDRGVTSKTVIGAGTKLDNMVQIGHDTVIGKNCLLASQVGIAGVVTVEDDVILWGQVGVQKDLT